MLSDRYLSLLAPVLEKNRAHINHMLTSMLAARLGRAGRAQRQAFADTSAARQHTGGRK